MRRRGIAIYLYTSICREKHFPVTASSEQAIAEALMYAVFLVATLFGTLSWGDTLFRVHFFVCRSGAWRAMEHFA